jgi:hypothetical protein
MAACRIAPMKITMHAASVGVFEPMLRNLSAILDKAVAHAQAKKIDPAVLLASRLAPDMFPLIRQVQLASDFAKNSTARIAGQDPPRFADEEQTFDDLKARLARTLDFLETVPSSALEGAEDRDIRVPLRDRTLEMKGLPYLQRFALPNFFFHVTTAYAILRHNGLEIGKRDFTGHV